MKKYYEAAVNVSLKFKIGIPADSREEAAEKLQKITRNNGENPDNIFLDMIEDLQDMAADELFENEEVNNEDYEVTSEIMEAKDTDVKIIRFADRMLIRPQKNNMILKMVPAEEQEFVTEELAERMILGYGGFAACNPIEGTNAFMVCNARCVFKIDGEDFSIGPVFLFDSEMNPIDPETAKKAAEIVKKSRAMLCADGREIPAYRLNRKGGSKK